MPVKKTLKLRLILLATIPMLIAIIASTWYAHHITNELLADQTHEKLILLRELKKQQVENFFNTIRKQLSTTAKGTHVKDAASKMSTAFYLYDTEMKRLGIQQEKTSLATFYINQFGQQYSYLNPQSGISTSDIMSQLSKNQAVLQTQFISRNPHPLGEKHLLRTAADDNSRYNRLHTLYHPMFLDLLQQFDYQDILIAHPVTGDIVYSTSKKIDFATSLLDGPYANSGIGQAYAVAASATDPNFVYVGDFSAYTPSYENTAAFLSAPILHEQNLLGVIIFQISDDTLNTIMTARDHWQHLGLGKSTVSYLVSHDKPMHYSSRPLLGTPEDYDAAMLQNNPDQKNLDTILVSNTSMNAQAVESSNIEKALQGETGFGIDQDYRGITVFSAYSRIDIEGLHWAILSQTDVEEAHASAHGLSDALLFSVGAIALVTLTLTIFSSWILSKSITAPLGRLESEVGRVGPNLDLTLRLQSIGNDATTGIATILNRMFERMYNIVSMIASASQSIETAAIKVNNTSIRSTKSTQHQGTESTRSMNQTMQEMTDTINTMANHIDAANRATKEANTLVNQGNQVVASVATSVNDLAEEVHQTSNMITQLAEDSENIAHVLGVIRTIAEQANLLALNASIEAARAGEQGRGFASVAEEVRTLANRTQASTAEVQSMIEQLQSVTRNAVSTSSKGQHQAEISILQVNQASIALQKIAHSIANIILMNENVTNASSKQRAVTEKIGASIQHIVKVSTTSIQDAKKNAHASRELTQLADNLKSAIQRFNLN